ncbi:MAG: endonuclease/exonuclease/phosphatase family protein [Rubrimonas sp.]|uniref:endonuclease/exonuclease/phosphatase family protein n=1 Tax=Rubrimonas sp. TaxID=2036015 RepID=UPI002FDDFCE9
MARRGLTAALLLAAGAALADPPPPAPGALRVAVFNTALSRDVAGALAHELRLGSRQIDAVAEIVQRVRPDIVLLLEIDRDDAGTALGLFVETLREGRRGAEGIDYPHSFAPPSNTGLLTGHDLDGDGEVRRPRDAQGFGLHEGHYAMALLSRFPIAGARTFQTLLWSQMPENLIPPGHYAPEAEAALRLSSKSHWDIGIAAPGGELRILASHPTPPVFDGPEDANGRRNADEIGFWTRYLSGEDWMTDDQGVRGGAATAPFALLGDLNADPADGDGRREAIAALLAHPRLTDPQPRSAGGAAAADPGHAGDPALDTAAFRKPPEGPGALRVDFVLPSAELEIAGSGVFWPAPGDRLRRLVGEGDRIASSDHRLVWVDVIAPRR